MGILSKLKSVFVLGAFVALMDWIVISFVAPLIHDVTSGIIAAVLVIGANGLVLMYLLKYQRKVEDAIPVK